MGVLFLGAMLAGVAWTAAWVLWQVLATSRLADITSTRQQVLAEAAQVLELAARWPAGPEAWAAPGAPPGHKAALTQAWQAVRHQPASAARAWWPAALDPTALTWEDTEAGIRMCWPGGQGVANTSSPPLILPMMVGRVGGPEEVCHEWR